MTFGTIVYAEKTFVCVWVPSNQNRLLLANESATSLAVKLLVLHCLQTTFVITGDYLDRLDSSSSGLRASPEPVSEEEQQLCRGL